MRSALSANKSNKLNANYKNKHEHTSKPIELHLEKRGR